MAKRRQKRGRSGIEKRGARSARRERTARWNEAPILAAFALSGFAGLVHQVVWAKLLASFVGATAHAQAGVLAVFMGGLAIGAVTERSRFVEGLDPLASREERAAETDSLLDRYIAYRAALGEPVRRTEIHEVMKRYKPPISTALGLRLQKAPTAYVPPTRPSRGFVGEPETMGRYEALYWARRYAADGRSGRALRYRQRVKDLDGTDRDGSVRDVSYDPTLGGDLE